MNNTFNIVYSRVEAAVALDATEYGNGTGYFDEICTLELGTDVCRFEDDHGRRGLILPIVEGFNIVIFERFKDNDILVANVPPGNGLEACLGLNGEVSDDTLDVLMGSAIWAEEGKRIPLVAQMAQALCKSINLRQKAAA